MQKGLVNEDGQFRRYPEISDRLIECLREDFPDRLPRNFRYAYEFGVLVGQQQVIDKLVTEKEFNETEKTEGENNV